MITGQHITLANIIKTLKLCLEAYNVKVSTGHTHTHTRAHTHTNQFTSVLRSTLNVIFVS